MPKTSEKFGVQELCEHVEDETGEAFTPQQMRAVLRRLAADDVIDRDVTPDKRTRYSWSGPNAKEVKAVVRAIKNGDVVRRPRKKSSTKKKSTAKKKSSKSKKK